MKQNKFQLAEVLNFGLLKSNPGGVNQSGFLELQNLRPWATSLKYCSRLDSVSVSSRMQSFTLTQGVFGCARDGVYKLVAGVLVKQLTLADSTLHWSVADFTKFAILSNGLHTVYVDESGACSTTKPFDASLPASSSMTHAGGQLVLGGLTSAFNDLDSTYVAWSRIGAINFTCSIDNESGFHNPQIGIVYNVLPFEKGFLAFGEMGVAKYYPAGVTFGYEKISDVGTLGKAYCAGNEKGCWYVDIHGQLNAIIPNKGVEVLDYAWLLEDKELALFLSTTTNELWIENSNGNYVVNKYGMYQVSIVVSGIGLYQGKPLAFVLSGVQTDAVFRTARLDFNIGGLKTLSEVYAQDSSVGSKYIEITVHKGGTDYVSREFLENEEGISHPHLTGNVMSVQRRTADYLDGEISNFHIQTVRVDGRSGLGWTGGNK